MTSFCIYTPAGQSIRFRLYETAATQTSRAFVKRLPFEQTFLHARISGQEIWTDQAPALDIPQENASIFAEPGEVIIGPLSPERNKISQCMGIFYGPGQLLDCGNIFGKVWPEDMDVLQALGDAIWREGGQLLHFALWQAKETTRA